MVFSSPSVCELSNSSEKVSETSRLVTEKTELKALAMR